MTSDLYTKQSNFLVVLDSRNATTNLNYPYNSNATFEFEDPIVRPKNSLKFSCSLISFTCPASFYNVNNYNNMFIYNSNAISVPYGNYNATTITAFLQSALPNTYSISLNLNNNKFTITNTTSFSIGGIYNTIGAILGYNDKTVYTSSLVNTLYSITLPYTCNFNGLQNMNIFLSSLNTNNIDSFNKSNSSIIQSIPVATGLSQILYQKTNEFNFEIRDDTLNVITIEIKDDLENFINFNNQNWNMTLQITCVHDIDRFYYRNDFNNILKKGGLIDHTNSDSE